MIPDGEILVGLFGLLGVLITAIVAPKLKARDDARRAARAEHKADDQQRANLLDYARSQLYAELTGRLEAQQRQIDRLEARNADLSSEVSMLTRRIDAYESGLQAPRGFVALPVEVVAFIRDRYPEALPERPFPGERALPADVAAAEETG